MRILARKDMEILLEAAVALGCLGVGVVNRTRLNNRLRLIGEHQVESNLVIELLSLCRSRGALNNNLTVLNVLN